MNRFIIAFALAMTLIAVACAYADLAAAAEWRAALIDPREIR
jgi:hypothetical protein